MLPDDPRVRDLRVTPHSLGSYDQLYATASSTEVLDGDDTPSDLSRASVPAAVTVDSSSTITGGNAIAIDGPADTTAGPADTTAGPDTATGAAGDKEVVP